MSRVWQGCFLCRLWLWFGAIWRESGLYRLRARCRATFAASATRRIGGRILGCEARTTESAGVTRLLTWWNGVLWRWGRRIVPAVEGSLLRRIYGAVFRCGRHSKIFGWLFRGGLTAFILTAVGLYSIVDYALRDLLAVPVVSSVWDEALLLLAVLWILYDRMRAPRAMLSRANPLDQAVFLFMGVGLGLMFLVSPFFSIAVAGYRATVQYMLWFFVLTRLLRDDRDFMLLYMVLVLAAFAIALHGIYQFVVAAPIPSSWTDQAETAVRTRVYSIFGSPNIMGDFMVMFAPMAAGLAYYCKDTRAKVFFWFVTFCMCFSCLFTMSRGAWVAMAAAILVFSLLVDRRLLILMLIAGVCAMFVPFVASRLSYLWSDKYQFATNNGGRASRWMLALSYLSLDPVFGFGLGMFGGAVAMQNQVYKWMSYFYVDNYYLKILVEMGWVGFITFILLMLCLLFTGLRALYRTSRRPETKRFHPLCAGIFAGLCGVLVHCYFENIFEEPYMMAYFWTMAALLIYQGFLRQRDRQAT